jgi:endoglucanase
MMPRTRRAGGAALACVLLASPAAAQTPRYRNFDLAIYCRVDDVRRMAEGDWLEKSFDALAKDLKIGKVYLETHRSRVQNDRETGATVPGQPRGDATAFPVFLEPHSYRAFERRKAGPSGASAHAFDTNRKLGRGVNVIGYDPIWQDPTKARFKEGYFSRIKEAGFDSIRVNLHPFRHMDAAKGYGLEPSWLETLDWAVKGALAAHLAVLLDMHEFHAMAEDPAGRKEAWLAFWKQVAPRFKDAPDEVVFELLNEPFGKLTPELWNEYLKEGLAVVRATNPTRVVVLGGGRWNSIDGLQGLVLPEDDRNLIATVHYYTPMEFTHQGAPWNAENKDKSGVQWTGSDQERQRIDQDFARAQQWAAAHDRPVLLGEFGAYDKAPMDSRARYTAAVARAAERLGWSWAYWQFDSDFVVYDIEKDAWVEPIRKALIP